jgi:hypothetical protein
MAVDLNGEPPYTCDLFQRLAAQLTPEQQGELETIRHEVIKLREWGRRTCAAERARMLDALERHDWHASSIFRYYYPSATGDWVDLRELRKMLGEKT